MPSPAAQQRSDQKKAPAPVSVQAEDRAAQEPASVQPGPGGVVKKHGISTGAIVAGAIGVAGLVGIVALAVSGKGKTTTRYRTRKGKTKTRWRTRKAPTKKSTHKKHAKGKKKAHKKHGKKR
jgi:hypothetical protein